MPYPRGTRALITFDAATGRQKVRGEPKQYSFARRGWGRFVASLVGEGVPLYDDDTSNDLVPGKAYKHSGAHVAKMIKDYAVAGPWSVAESASRFLADDEGFTAFFATKEDAVDAYADRYAQKDWGAAPEYAAAAEKQADANHGATRPGF